MIISSNQILSNTIRGKARRISIGTRDSVLLLFSLLLPLSIYAQVEICDNGIDDDNDQLIDINDDDCACKVVAPKSLIANPSFEELDCCPDGRSQLNCASGWIQASQATTDFIHACDWVGGDQFTPPLPFPDGDGIIGFRDGRVRSAIPEPYWKEYAGACLISPLRADSSYRFRFSIGFIDVLNSPPIDITFFGTSSCEHLPFGIADPAFGCPANDTNWVEIGQVFVSGDDGDIWIDTFINIVPTEDMYAVAIGPSCDSVINPVSTYYFFDNLQLVSSADVNLEIAEIGHPCSPDFTLSVPYYEDISYQWYLSGAALEGETSASLSKNYGEGSYQVRIVDQISCSLSPVYEYLIPDYTTARSISICSGESYQLSNTLISTSGIYFDTLRTKDLCDSIIILDIDISGESYDTLEVTIVNGETFDIGGFTFDTEGDFPVTLTSSQGCDSLLLLRLTTHDVYIPNIFSPNADGINDLFYLTANHGTVAALDMKIYDRWGNMIFQGQEWSGQDVGPGVYAYVIHLQFIEGGSQWFKGNITLIK